MIVRQTEIFQKWFNKLNDEMAKAIIHRRIRVIGQKGHFGDYCSVGDGVSELRIQYGAGYRLYCTIRGQEIVILLCGGDKSSQERDIKKAKELNKKV